MMRKLNIYVFTLLFIVSLAGCHKEVDYRQQFIDLTRQQISFHGDCENENESYSTIVDTSGSYIRYDFNKLDSNKTPQYEIKGIQYINSTIGTDKPVLISYPEHEIESDYGKDNTKLQIQLDQFLGELDMDMDELDAFMIWYREHYPIKNIEYK